MSTDYTYLFYTVLIDIHTDKHAVDLSEYDKEFKKVLLSKCHPITHMDIICGNFIVWVKDDEIIIYKVIHAEDTLDYFTVANKNSYSAIFYDRDKNDRLFCKSADSNKSFFLKISETDLKRLVKNVTIRYDIYDF
jgi:hypothetical protein